MDRDQAAIYATRMADVRAHTGTRDPVPGRRAHYRAAAIYRRRL